MVYDFWDVKADSIKKGDNLRDVIPISSKTKMDENGFTHYVFSKKLFQNPRFVIPNDDYELFEKFLDGGSREYPSDGNVPVDVMVSEANLVLNKISEFANDSNHIYSQIAREELKNNGKYGLVRGTIKLYLGDYTTRDWRRKRFTDDIDFWILNKNLLEYALEEAGWKKNKETKEFEKIIKWENYSTKNVEISIIIASNDTDQLLDFCNGSYLEGSALKNIFTKKLKRGHDVDLSDIINVAIVNNRENGEINPEWIDAWDAFEKAVNTRSSRIISNIICLCRFSYGIAEYLERVSKAIDKYSNLVFEKTKYSDKEIINVCKASSHYFRRDSVLKPDLTRNRIYNNLIVQKTKKQQYSKNLRNFANKVLELLNSKFFDNKIIFEIEN